MWRNVLVLNPQQAKRDHTIREVVGERADVQIERRNAQLATNLRTKAHSQAVCSLKAYETKGRFIRELETGQRLIEVSPLPP